MSAQDEGGRVAESLVNGLLLSEDMHFWLEGSEGFIVQRLQWHSIAPPFLPVNPVIAIKGAFVTDPFAQPAPPASKLWGSSSVKLHEGPMLFSLGGCLVEVALEPVPVGGGCSRAVFPKALLGIQGTVFPCSRSSVAMRFADHVPLSQSHELVFQQPANRFRANHKVTGHVFMSFVGLHLSV
nr:hypothetical protein CFP56_45129 [Quercus suber]